MAKKKAAAKPKPPKAHLARNVREQIHTPDRAVNETVSGAEPWQAPPKPPVEPKRAANGKKLAKLVEIIPGHRAEEGYREMDVIALQDVVYGQRIFNKGDAFRIALNGPGEPPTWAKPIG